MSINNNSTKKRIGEFIRVRINSDIILTVTNIADFKYWKTVFPNASILYKTKGETLGLC
mgnify:CR=1 FL=1